MGSKPWKNALSWRLVSAAEKTAPHPLMLGVKSGRKTHMGEYVGTGGRNPYDYLILNCRGRERDIPLSGDTLIDGVPAPDWGKS